MQPAAKPDEDLAEAIIGSDQLRLDAEPPAQGKLPRLFGEKRIGAGLDDKTACTLRRDRAAQAVTRLDDLDVQVDTVLACELRGAVGRSDARYAAADHDEVHCNEGREAGVHRGWPALGTSRLRAPKRIVD